MDNVLANVQFHILIALEFIKPLLELNANPVFLNV